MCLKLQITKKKKTTSLNLIILVKKANGLLTTNLKYYG